MQAQVNIRAARPDDWPGIWRVLSPVFGAGETYAVPRDWSEEQARTYWFQGTNEVFVAEESARILGTYFLRANALGGGSHVANCGYVTAPDAQGKGIARTMCEHSQARAKARGFRAMQFNFVIATNDRAIALWTKLGFTEVGRLPKAFNHPRLGLVDALVMFKTL